MRAASEPREVLERGRQLERDADARQVGELLRDADILVASDAAVARLQVRRVRSSRPLRDRDRRSGPAPAMLVPSEVFLVRTRSTERVRCVETPRSPTSERFQFLARRELEPVVVGGGAPQRQFRFRREQGMSAEADAGEEAVVGVEVDLDRLAGCVRRRGRALAPRRAARPVAIRPGTRPVPTAARGPSRTRR